MCRKRYKAWKKKEEPLPRLYPKLSPCESHPAHPTPSSSFSLTPKATSPVFSAYKLLLFSVPQHGCFSTSHLLGFSASQLPSLPAPQLLNILASDSQLLSVPESQLHNNVNFSNSQVLILFASVTSTSHLSVVQLLSLNSFSAQQHLSF